MTYDKHIQICIYICRYPYITLKYVHIYILESSAALRAALIHSTDGYIEKI